MRSLIATAVCVSLAAAAASAAASETSTRQPTQIPAQSLGSALQSFAQERQIYLIFAAQDVTPFHTHGAVGDLTVDETLTRLLDGTGLTYRYIDDRTVSIVPLATSSAKEQTRKEQRTAMQPIAARVDGASVRVRTAQADSSTAAMEAQTDPTGAEEKARQRLEELVVTGSHIRGAQNLSVPMIAIDRDEIDASGYATTQELVRGLPQNLGNVSEQTQGAFNGGSSPAVAFEGSGINLRGLGSDSTLVLLDGRRLAPAGAGTFVDISLLPLSAVERIEVLTDGASAVYGSDAVGGVVNFRLRKDYEGMETRIRYGTVTEGRHDNFLAGQMLGRSWAGGNVLLNYEYFQQNALESADRSFFRQGGYYANIKLVPEQTRHGALAVLSQRLSDGIELSGQVSFGKRRSSSDYGAGDLPTYAYDAQVQQLDAALGLTVDFANDWQARITGVWDRNESELWTRLVSTGAVTQNIPLDNRVWSVDAAADGTLAELSGRAIRVGLGAQFRREGYADSSEDSRFDIRREIKAAYVDLAVPLVGASNRRPGIDRLDLNLAARFEDYSDFGTSFNPKFGVSWLPVQDLNVRLSWGTSFRAPPLTLLNPIFYATIHDGVVLDESGPVPVLSIVGQGVPNLGPQEATT